MPLYEYQCLSCGTKSEILQRFSDPPLAACPQCGGEVRKLVSSPSFQFKGSGFYATDYGGKKGDDAKAGDKADGGKSGAGSEAKSDAKSDDKPASKPETAKPSVAASTAGKD